MHWGRWMFFFRWIALLSLFATVRNPLSRASDSPAQWLLPSSAHIMGVGGVLWKTDLILSNYGASEAQIFLKFLGNNQDGRAGREETVVLSAGQTVTVEDVLGSLFKFAEAYGAIRITSSSLSLQVQAQTYTAGETGGYGQSMPAVPVQDWIPQGVSRSICAVSENQDFRTNLILANPLETPATIEVVLLNGAGQQLGKKVYPLPPLGMTQINRVVPELGYMDAIADARLQLRTTAPESLFTAFATLIDNQTHDPRTLWPSTPASWLLPSCARIPGTGSSFWTTDLTVTNTGTSTASFMLQFLSHDADGRQGPVKPLQLEAGQSATYRDCLNTLFGVSSGYGAILLQAAEARLSLQAQTWTPSGGGRMGQSLPAAGSADLVAGNARQWIVAIREDSTFRTNLVLANPTPAELKVEALLVDGTGEILGSKSYLLPPLGMRQIDRCVRDFGISGEVRGARIGLTTSTPEGMFAAYAVAIDNRTNDPRTLLPRAEAESPGQTLLALVNGTLIDGTGAEPVPDAALLIRDARIAAAGRRSQIRIPANARVLDLGGGTILPGFFNAHVHGTRDESSLRAWVQAGVTTVRDMGTSLTNLTPTLAMKARASREADLARVVGAGSFVTVPGGYPAYWGSKSLDVSSPAEAREKAFWILDQGADFIKIALESGIDFGQPGWPMLSREETEAVRQAARERGTRVAVHVEIVDDLARALDYGVDDIAHMVTDELRGEALIRKMIEGNVYWVPTLELWDGYHRRYPVGNLARFAAAGGKVALGTDFNGAPVPFQSGMPIREIELMQQAGMTPFEIILAATRNAAVVCNQQRQLGTLEAGKLADVLVVKGNPLEDIHAFASPLLVLRQGVIVRNLAQ